MSWDRNTQSMVGLVKEHDGTAFSGRVKTARQSSNMNEVDSVAVTNHT